MKISKLDKGVLIFGCLAVAAGCIIHFSGCTEQNKKVESEYYPLTAFVTEINANENLISVTDNNGQVWQFDDSSDWRNGDICSMIMNDNGTENIFDDEVVAVRNAGRFYE